MCGKITSLCLKNFRSYRFLDINTDSDFVIFVGQNGAGKTNILEALSLLSNTKGIRKASLDELKNLDANSGFKVEATLVNGAYESTLSTYFIKDKRQGEIDFSQTKTLDEFEKMLWFLWVTPQMSEFITGQSALRRGFFDHLVSGIDPKHHFRLQYTKKLQKERMHIMQNNYDNNWLSSIELKLAELFVKIDSKRREFLDVLHNVLSNNYSDLLRPNVTVSGNLENVIFNVQNDDKMMHIIDVLARSRLYDKDRGVTNYSVMRTNWEIKKNDRINAQNCSSGEQKSMLISLILAAVRIYKSFRHGVPILLLDDIMVQLDSDKRRFLVEELKGLNIQTFLTGTDDYLFSDFQNKSKVFFVHNSICSQK